jgi:hypothetical protein
MVPAPAVRAVPVTTAVVVPAPVVVRPLTAAAAVADRSCAVPPAHWQTIVVTVRPTPPLAHACSARPAPCPVRADNGTVVALLRWC